MKSNPYEISSNKLFFTSDTHWGHEHIIGFCGRPFTCLEQMNDRLTQLWNDTVPEDGIVFHLGDFAWGSITYWEKIRASLNGTIHLVLGNHDYHNVSVTSERLCKLFETISFQRILKIKEDNRTVILNHYPFLCYAGTYRNEKDAVYQLFGHVHTSPTKNGKDYERLVNLFPTQYDVGVDNNDYRPISWEEVNKKIQEQIRNSKNE